jgi:hypothetical protein
MSLGQLFWDFLQWIAIGVGTILALLLLVRFRTGSRSAIAVRRSTN